MYEMIGDMLSDTALFKTEDQIHKVCEKIEALMFGKGADLAILKVSHQPQKLKSGPYRMGGEDGKIQAIEAEMSLYSYMPSYEVKTKHTKSSYIIMFTILN